MLDETQPEAPAVKKSSGLIVTIGAVVAVTIVGGAGGWLVGNMLAPQVEPPKVEKAAEEKPAEGEDVAAALDLMAGQEGAGLIAVVHRHAGFLEGLFHASTAKRLALYTNTPLLVLQDFDDEAEEQP